MAWRTQAVSGVRTAFSFSAYTQLFSHHIICALDNKMGADYPSLISAESGFDDEDKEYVIKALNAWAATGLTFLVRSYTVRLYGLQFSFSRYHKGETRMHLHVIEGPVPAVGGLICSASERTHCVCLRN